MNCDPVVRRRAVSAGWASSKGARRPEPTEPRREVRRRWLFDATRQQVSAISGIGVTLAEIAETPGEASERVALAPAAPDASLSTTNAGRVLSSVFGRLWFSLCRAFQSAMLAFAILLTVSSGGEPLGQPATRPGPADIPAVERPTTLAALLVNAKLAAEQWLLLREDFYRADVLQQYFGGAVVKFIDRQSSSVIRGTISGFDNIVDPITVQGKKIEGISCSFRREVAADGTVTALVYVHISGGTTLDFDTVERLFESGGRQLELRRPPLDEPRMPLSLDKYLYSRVDGGRELKILLSFIPRGELTDANFWTMGVP
jgi:hypothetical protein